MAYDAQIILASGGAPNETKILYNVPQSSPRKRSILQQNSKIQTVRLFQDLGTHYADLWCGTSEPQRQTVIVDTGSSNTAFPCSECQNCGKGFHVDEPFLQQLSKSYQKATCQDCSLGTCQGGDCRFGVSYLEGSSWSAFEAFDTCYLGGFHNEATPTTRTGPFHWFGNGRDPHSAQDFAFHLRFGCQTDITGDFTHQMADGIMGMSNGPSAAWHQMYSQGKISSRAFSLCFQRLTETRRSGTESGVMTLGGSDTKLHNHAMAFTSLEGGSFYSVHLRKVHLRQGGKTSSGKQVISIPIPEALYEPSRKHVIIDSGTTDTYFTQEMQADFYAAWHTLVGTDFTNDPVSLSSDALEALPSLVLQFNALDGNQNIADIENARLAGELDPDHPFDLIVIIPPSHFMEYHPDQKGYVAGMYWDEPEGIVLGANTMMGHDILFDVESSRIGWAESSCNYTEVAEGDTASSSKLYASPFLRFRPPQAHSPNRVATSDRILLIAASVLVAASVMLGFILYLVRKTLWKSISTNTARLSSPLTGLTIGREIRRSVSSRTRNQVIQRSTSISSQHRVSSDFSAKRQIRRNESRSLLYAVPESQESNNELQKQSSKQFPTRMLSERTGLLRSRSQQVERDRCFVSTI